MLTLRSSSPSFIFTLLCALSLPALTACSGSEEEQANDRSGAGGAAEEGMETGGATSQTGGSSSASGGSVASGGASSSGGAENTGGHLATGGDQSGTGGVEQCPPCVAPPHDSCVGSGPCGCGPYTCPDDGVTCGDVVCSEGQVCCNALLSICAAPDEVCLF